MRQPGTQVGESVPKTRRDDPPPGGGPVLDYARPGPAARPRWDQYLVALAFAVVAFAAVWIFLMALIGFVSIDLQNLVPSLVFGSFFVAGAIAVGAFRSLLGRPSPQPSPLSTGERE